MADTTVTLNAFCLTVLKGILAAPGWADAGQNWVAGQLLEEVIWPLNVPQEPTEGDLAAHREWAKQEYHLGLRKRQIDVIAACVKHFAGNKSFPCSFHLRPLLALAGLAPDAE